MNGKGSKRRKRQISREEFDRNWARTFRPRTSTLEKEKAKKVQKTIDGEDSESAQS
jgi:hypothetical protein